MTSAKYDKNIETQLAEAKAEKAKGDREAKKINADGTAYEFETVDTAQAKNIDEVGTSEAGVIKKKTAAMDKGLFAQVEMIKYLAENNIELVPKILVQGSDGGDGTGNGILSALIGNDLLNKVKNNENLSEGSNNKTDSKNSHS